MRGKDGKRIHVCAPARACLAEIRAEPGHDQLDLDRARDLCVDDGDTMISKLFSNLWKYGWPPTDSRTVHIRYHPGDHFNVCNQIVVVYSTVLQGLGLGASTLDEVYQLKF